MFGKKKSKHNTNNDLNQRIEEVIANLNEYEKRVQTETKNSNRYAMIQAMCGNTSVEDKVIAATNYELGLQIMKKQLTDQLIYIGGGDEALISTARFNSVEECCKNMLSIIDVLLQNNSKI